MKFGSLFAGIGGFDLGLERAGMTCSWQVEIDDYANKILEKHWPEVKRYRDIREVGKHNLEPVDLICGGFPCQPFSVAGKQGGKEDDRYLWPEMFRVISEIKPTWVIGENVAGFVSMALDDCLASLEGEGYETQSLIIPACAIGAKHKRDRLWIIAYTKSERQFQSTLQSGVGSEMHFWKRNQFSELLFTEELQKAPDAGDYRNIDGLPTEMDRLKCLGNAVVPQIPEILGRAILNVT